MRTGVLSKIWTTGLRGSLWLLLEQLWAIYIPDIGYNDGR